MTLIPEVREELGTTLERATSARRRRIRRRRLFGLAPVVALVTATAAVAASGVIDLGSPASDPPQIAQYAPKPGTGNGVAVARSARVLAVRAPDPDGGPAWGLRLSSTTRGLGCLIPGRVVGGRLGVYGRYGAFHDDGRLHPFPTDLVTGPNDCAPLDAGGRLIMSADVGAAQASASRERVCPRIASGLCAAGTERALLYGTVGPGVTRITYTTAAGTKTAPVRGPEGAYLIVLPTPQAGLLGAGITRYPQAAAIRSLTLRDGKTCTPSELGKAPCQLPGYRPQKPAPLTHRDVAAGVTATARQGRRYWNLTVTFRAPVAINDATATYLIREFPPGHTGRSGLSVTRRNYRRGEPVTVRFRHLHGGGAYRIVVKYGRAENPGALPDYTRSPTVGRTRITLR